MGCTGGVGHEGGEGVAGGEVCVPDEVDQAGSRGGGAGCAGDEVGEGLDTGAVEEGEAVAEGLRALVWVDGWACRQTYGARGGRGLILGNGTAQGAVPGVGALDAGT